ncbi:MAG TPA: NHL repeat-containing protein, partial [Gemmatimonadales bacterium]|nr:NHL repeat-containing protein [Gemmatimonadales bacterium]
MLQERAYYLKLRLAEKTMRCSRRSLVALTALSFACLQSDPPSAPVVAAKLAFVRQPTNTFQGTLIAPFVQVAAEDSAGARATGFTDVITLSLTSSSPGGTTLSGNAVAAIDGIATFTELQVNQPGNGYTLTATATGIARATSTAFDVAAVLGKSALSLYVANAMPRAFAPSNVPYSVAVFAPGATGNARPALAFKDAFIAPFGIAVDGAGRVYVACYTAIMIYGTSTGTPERVAMIAGGNTGLAQPAGVALDRTGNVYVANYGNSTITVYAAGASGDATPIATIGGSNTLLSGPNGIAVDTSGNLYVANFQYPPGAGVSRITVFAVGASGNVAPTAMIQGSSTALAAPWGIALDSAENLYVANSYGGSVTVYAPGANGNEPPAVTIAGSNTGLNILTGLAVDATGRIYVGDGRQRVYVFAAGASGNVAPIATIGGDITGLNIPYALAVGGSGTLYASNFMVNTVTLYPAGANGNVPPTTTIRA